ncbi:phage virion morphogenesis protein [Mucilaginibacter ximonensis]|uniref:Phage virion morphogenesis protein n=1 Tax=Mucilaginibacter ximonensis TaxID=538021 RepID=A0ABW5YGY2_9SPHI
MSKGREQVKIIFSKLKSGMDAAMNELPMIIGNEVVNYTLEAFDKQGWNGKPWEERKNDKDPGRAINIKTGRMKRGNRIIRTTVNSVVVGNDVPYAPIHNNGGVIKRSAHSETFVRPRFKRGDNRGKFRRMTREERSAAPAQGFQVKAYEINMPQRQFIGVTPEEIKRVKRVANQHIIKFIKR